MACASAVGVRVRWPGQERAEKNKLLYTLSCASGKTSVTADGRLTRCAVGGCVFVNLRRYKHTVRGQNRGKLTADGTLVCGAETYLKDKNSN